MTRGRLFFTVGGALGVLALACGVLSMPDVPIAPLNTCAVDTDCTQAYPDASTDRVVRERARVEERSVSSDHRRVDSDDRAERRRDVRASEQLLARVRTCRAERMREHSSVADMFFSSAARADPKRISACELRLRRRLWPPGGLQPNIPQNPTALPTRTIFHPMWIDPVTGHPVLATKLGLPLPDILAQQSTTNFLSAPTNGTTHVLGPDFSVNVPQPLSPTDPSAFYGFEIVPTDPYGVFPPFVRPADPRLTTDAGAPAGDPWLLDGFGVIPATTTLTPLYPAPPTILYDPSQSLPPVAAPFAQPITINEGPGLGLSLEGWSAYIVDVDGRRISGLAILPAGATKMLTLYESFNMVQSSLTLIIVLPPTLDMPSLEDNTGLFAAAHTYLALPPVGMVSGAVLRSDELGTQTSAHITFVANGNTPSATLIHADSSPAPELNYEKTIATDVGGNYSMVPLPPGSLRAYVVPDDPNLTITLNDSYQVAANSSQPQTGKTLNVNPRTHVTGRVVLADGTPLYAATVVVSPSGGSSRSRRPTIRFFLSARDARHDRRERAVRCPERSWTGRHFRSTARWNAISMGRSHESHRTRLRRAQTAA